MQAIFEFRQIKQLNINKKCDKSILLIESFKFRWILRKTITKYTLIDNVNSLT